MDQYLEGRGRSPRDLPGMYAKTGAILGWFAASYVWLVFGATGVWGAAAGCVSLGLAMAGIGFSIMHDANHGSYSDRRFINRLMGWTLDVVGGSSYVWSWKHNIFHHSHPNVAGLDEDIDIQPLCRIAPGQRSYAAHRFQHLYIWLLYGLLPLKWHFIDDFRNLVSGRIGHQKMPRPSAWKLTGVLAGKLLFFGWALGIPLLVHSAWQVALGYAVTSLVLGVTLSTVFQLAHCVEEAEFREVPEGNHTFPRDWAEHQVETTVDFARGNPLVSWYLGGLNFQVEHHLFPRVSHLHYPALSRIVERTCQEHGIRYRSQQSVGAALKSHVRWLKRMGRPALEGGSLVKA
ncbi:linoleoyl-CoA desaturase (Delta(6)-desaturase) [Stigmatella aurantiaca DW4/3-1]|uniref:Linoleoyl-CoA desaturase (Delta(6)-desaturase) n=1 Tax=Stigmatella aurantiaca (strain DW4/3-1) TaxID=378806 RepID=Q096T3_STIAD|nr:linoleoyl-CoA desaturase (Delta(6)-desaturase) [Stigmatella aurantiaca DW4/3-1]